MKARWWLILLVLATARLGAAPEIEFTGVLSAGRDTKVFLVDKASGQSRWVKFGQDFGGYVVSAYDAPAEVVVLTKDGQQFRVKLKDAKVTAGTVTEPTPEMKKAILNNLRMLAAASDQFYLENGVDHVTYDELVGPTKYVKEIVVQAGENYRGIVFKQGTRMSVTTSSGFTTSYEP